MKRRVPVWESKFTLARQPLANRPAIHNRVARLTWSYDRSDECGSLMRAVDVDRGEVLWEYVISAIGTEPSIGMDGTAFWADLSGRISAIDASGVLRWCTESVPSLMCRALATVGGRVIVASNSLGKQRMRSLDAETGTVVWDHPFEEHCWGYADAADAIVFIVLATKSRKQSRIICRDASTGELLWQREAPVGARCAHVHAGVLFVAALGQLRAYRMIDGVEIVSLQTGVDSACYSMAWNGHGFVLAYCNGVGARVDVLVESGDSNVSMKMNWGVTLAASISAAPALVGDRACFLSDAGEVTVVDEHSGVRVESIDCRPPKEDYGGVAALGGRLLVARGQRVAAFDLLP